jgi:hypothetical protein
MKVKPKLQWIFQEAADATNMENVPRKSVGNEQSQPKKETMLARPCRKTCLRLLGLTSQHVSQMPERELTEFLSCLVLILPYYLYPSL